MNPLVPEVDSLVNKLRGRVKFFINVGPSAQRLLLENGAWDRINDWMKVAIRSGNAYFVMETLTAARTMPTSASRLMANHAGLPLTVQELLKNLVRKTINFGQHTEAITMECAELFARWLRIKKNNLEETVDYERIMDSKTGEACSIAHIECMPGHVYMAINGKVEMMRMETVDNPPMPLPPSSPIPSSPVSSPITSSTDSKVKAKKAASKVFCTSKSRSEQLLEEMLQASSTKMEQSGDSSDKKEQQECNDKSNDVEPMLVDTPELLNQISTSLENEIKLAAETLTENTKKVQQQFEKDYYVNKIGDDLGPPKKMVRWWGHDGVKERHEYESSDSTNERDGCVKEKWISICVKDENDEQSDNDDDDMMIIDDEEDDWYSNMPGMKAGKTQKHRPITVVSSLMWKVHKIDFPPKKGPPSMYVSKEARAQQLRESMVVERNFMNCSDSPEEADKEEVKEYDEYGMPIETYIIPTEDFLEAESKYNRTRIRDHQRKKWPRMMNE